MKIKCVKLDKCPICDKDGSCQVFFNKQGKIKYARVRHYTGLNENKKPQFRYEKIEDLSQLETLLLSLNFEFPIAKSEVKNLSQATAKKNVDLLNNSNKLGQADSNLNFELEPRAGFDPATITLPR